MEPGAFVRILGPGQFNDPDLAGQVGRVVTAFRDCLVVETRPNAYFGRWPDHEDYWDNFAPEALAPAGADDLADYLIQQIGD